ncbi:MAG: bifunctional 5,10-methylene-tetrahydrofolate dehydrogenase/5,10-methylene-tetrahydrofolate cyclohydrolase [Candidatus Moranbacteria bacterium]|nr:bifunctional 5,10-methylene-tetrahydrofolate dehydrogenase/5,10-methylene-tetrahydrofolate cyclohydrolase [Candidatus Moranbacteria bacterium]
MTKIIDGANQAKRIRADVKKRLLALKAEAKLSVILVGEDQASRVYVGMKQKACDEAGVISQVIKINAKQAIQAYKSGNCLIKQTIRKLNNDPKTTGILVQLPLPEPIEPGPVLDLIDPIKDVDCLTSRNLGRFFSSGSDQDLTPCTPKGCLRLIQSLKLDLKGLQAVVIGRSNIVGKPMAQLLLNQDCTVTICHSQTRNLKNHTQKAELLVSAIGKPGFIKADMIKADSILIDVGISRMGKKLQGDFDFDSAAQKAGAITPVPGGVGPMTIAMLLENLLICYQLAHAQKKT